MKKITVNVAIAAYNAEQNIKRLIDSLLTQKECSYSLKHIIVNSDSSTDKTLSIAKGIKNKRVVVRDTHLRQGFAGAVVAILKKNDADIIVLLNDDIVITDNFFIEKTIAPFLEEKNVGLVCSNPQPFADGNIMQKAVASSFYAYENIRLMNKSGNNVLTCDGKTLTLSRKYISSLQFPKDLSEMANVDWYLYFSCVQNGFLYRFVEQAKVYYQNPSTIKDYIKWTTRNNTDLTMMKERFGSIFTTDYKLPLVPFAYYKAKEAIKNPVGCVLLFSLSIYCALKAKFSSAGFDSKWDLVETTKTITINQI